MHELPYLNNTLIKSLRLAFTPVFFPGFIFLASAWLAIFILLQKHKMSMQFFKLLSVLIFVFKACEQQIQPFEGYILIYPVKRTAVTPHEPDIAASPYNPGIAWELFLYPSY